MIFYPLLEWKWLLLSGGKSLRKHFTALVKLTYSESECGLLLWLSNKASEYKRDEAVEADGGNDRDPIGEKLCGWEGIIPLLLILLLLLWRWWLPLLLLTGVEDPSLLLAGLGWPLIGWSCCCCKVNCCNCCNCCKLGNCCWADLDKMRSTEKGPPPMGPMRPAVLAKCFPSGVGVPLGPPLLPM